VNVLKKPFFKTALLGALAVSCTLLPALAAPKKAPPDRFLNRQPWPNQRVVLILPLQFGAGWNLDKKSAAFILPEAEQKLQQAMQRTGKFSTTQVHRYNPILLRAVQDKLLTKEQVTTIVTAPTVANMQEALGKMNFDQPPLIAEFSMDEITTQAGHPNPTVSAQVTGKLYEVNDPTPVKTVVVTSDPQPLYYTRKQKGKTVYVRHSSGDRILKAADNAFDQVVHEFVKPLEDIALPEPPAPTGATVEGAPGVARPVIKVPQGAVLGTFPVPSGK
jgi:hypothetical protein